MKGYVPRIVWMYERYGMMKHWRLRARVKIMDEKQHEYRPSKYERRCDEVHMIGGQTRQVVLLHDDALALLSPRVVFLVGCVDQWVVLLVFLNILPHRGDAFWQWPAFHGCLVFHVLDLLLQCVLVHVVERTAVHARAGLPSRRRRRRGRRRWQ